MVKRLLSYSFMVMLVFTVFIGVANAATEEREVGAFRNIDMRGVGTVEISQGDTPSLSVATDAHLMRYVKTGVENGTLYMYIDSQGRNFMPTEGLFYKLVVTDLKKLALSGSTSAKGQLNFDQLNLHASGASNIKLNLKSDRITSSISGASKLHLSGKANAHTISVSGASKFSGFDLVTKTSNISVSGASKAEVQATDDLDISVSGASKVTYRGKPAKIGKDVTGSSKICSEDGTDVTKAKKGGNSCIISNGGMFCGNVVGGNVVTVNGRVVSGSEAQAVQQQVLSGLSGLFGSVGTMTIGGTTYTTGGSSSTYSGYDSSDSE